MASVRYHKLAVACLAIASVLLVSFSVVEGKKSRQRPRGHKQGAKETITMITAAWRGLDVKC